MFSCARTHKEGEKEKEGEYHIVFSMFLIVVPGCLFHFFFIRNRSAFAITEN